MVIASPRRDFRAMTPVIYDTANEQEGRFATALKQLQERARLHPIEVPAITANYTMVDTDLLIRANATGGNITVTLLTAAGRTGRRIVVKKTDASANLVTIDAAGAETLNDATTVSLTQKHASREYVSNGTNWDLVSAVGNATEL